MRKHNEHSIRIFTESGCLSFDAINLLQKDQLTPSQQKIIESHLKECPFCRDAVEGFAEMKDPSEAIPVLQDIDQRTSEKLKQYERRHLIKPARTSRRLLIASVAASIALLVGSMAYFAVIWNKKQYLFAEEVQPGNFKKLERKIPIEQAKKIYLSYNHFAQVLPGKESEEQEKKPDREKANAGGKQEAKTRDIHADVASGSREKVTNIEDLLTEEYHDVDGEAAFNPETTRLIESTSTAQMSAEADMRLKLAVLNVDVEYMEAERILADQEKVSSDKMKASERKKGLNLNLKRNRESKTALEEPSEAALAEPVKPMTEKNPRFPGGIQGFQSYLQDFLNGSLPAVYYNDTLDLSFAIDEKGNIIETEYDITDPEVESAVKKALELSPQWSPATFQDAIIKSRIHMKISLQNE